MDTFEGVLVALAAVGAILYFFVYKPYMNKKAATKLVDARDKNHDSKMR